SRVGCNTSGDGSFRPDWRPSSASCGVCGLLGAAAGVSHSIIGRFSAACAKDADATNAASHIPRPQVELNTAPSSENKPTGQLEPVVGRRHPVQIRLMEVGVFEPKPQGRNRLIKDVSVCKP